MGAENYKCAELYTRILEEQHQVSKTIAGQDTESFIQAMYSSPRVFFAGAGRSGLLVKTFAMRCMQMGLQVHVAGETTTPAIRSGDMLFIGSGSGETASLVQMAKKAKALGAQVALVTIYGNSSIGKLADHVIRLPGSSIKNEGEVIATVDSVQPAGNLFEQGMFLLFECLAMGLMALKGVKNENLFVNHANLE